MAWKALLLGIAAAQASARVVTVVVHQCRGSVIGFPSTIDYPTNAANYNATSSEHGYGCITTTVPFTGTPAVDCPQTVTVPAHGTSPCAVQILTPPGYVPPESYTTVSQVHTGTASLTRQTTVTIRQTGTSTGIIIIQTPSGDSAPMSTTIYSISTLITNGVAYTTRVPITVSNTVSSPSESGQASQSGVQNSPDGSPIAPTYSAVPSSPEASAPTYGTPPIYPPQPGSSTTSQAADDASSLSLSARDTESRSSNVGQTSDFGTPSAYTPSVSVIEILSSTQSISGPPGYGTTESRSSNIEQTSGFGTPPAYTPSVSIIEILSSTQSIYGPSGYSTTASQPIASTAGYPGQGASSLVSSPGQNPDVPSSALIPPIYGTTPALTSTTSASPQSPSALAACPQTSCGMQSTNSTTCDNSYGNPFEVSCGSRLYGRFVARAVAKDINSCLIACDTVPGCVGTNYYAQTDDGEANCELFDDVAGEEPAMGVSSSQRAIDENGDIATTESVSATGANTAEISFSIASTATIGWQTSTRVYTGTAQITRPTTVSTISPSGTISGTYIVETPISQPGSVATYPSSVQASSSVPPTVLPPGYSSQTAGGPNETPSFSLVPSPQSSSVPASLSSVLPVDPIGGLTSPSGYQTTSLASSTGSAGSSAASLSSSTALSGAGLPLTSSPGSPSQYTPGPASSVGSSLGSPAASLSSSSVSYPTSPVSSLGSSLQFTPGISASSSRSGIVQESSSTSTGYSQTATLAPGYSDISTAPPPQGTSTAVFSTGIATSSISNSGSTPGPSVGSATTVGISTAFSISTSPGALPSSLADRASTTPSSGSQTAATTSLAPAISSSQASTVATPATPSARPTFSCAQDDESTVTDPSGASYQLDCGSTTEGQIVGQASAPIDFNDCFAPCSANAQCLAWTYEGAAFGNGPGTCYLKDATSTGAQPYFTPASSYVVSGLRSRAVVPPGDQPPSAATSSTMVGQISSDGASVGLSSPPGLQTSLTAPSVPVQFSSTTAPLSPPTSSLGQGQSTPIQSSRSSSGSSTQGPAASSNTAVTSASVLTASPSSALTTTLPPTTVSGLSSVPGGPGSLTVSSQPQSQVGSVSTASSSTTPASLTPIVSSLPTGLSSVPIGSSSLPAQSSASLGASTAGTSLSQGLQPTTTTSSTAIPLPTSSAASLNIQSTTQSSSVINGGPTLSSSSSPMPIVPPVSSPGLQSSTSTISPATFTQGSPSGGAPQSTIVSSNPLSSTGLVLSSGSSTAVVSPSSSVTQQSSTSAASSAGSSSQSQAGASGSSALSSSVPSQFIGPSSASTSLLSSTPGQVGLASSTLASTSGLASASSSVSPATALTSSLISTSLATLTSQSMSSASSSVVSAPQTTIGQSTDSPATPITPSASSLLSSSQSIGQAQSSSISQSSPPAASLTASYSSTVTFLGVSSQTSTLPSSSSAPASASLGTSISSAGSSESSTGVQSTTTLSTASASAVYTSSGLPSFGTSTSGSSAIPSAASQVSSSLSSATGSATSGGTQSSTGAGSSATTSGVTTSDVPLSLTTTQGSSSSITARLSSSSSSLTSAVIMPGQSTTSTAISSSSLSSSAANPAVTGAGSCPGDNGATLRDSSGASYLVSCNSDIRDGNEIGSLRVPNSYQECFSACTALFACQGFSFQNVDGGTRGVGTGWCYFKNSTSPLTFTTGQADTNLAAIRVANPASSSASPAGSFTALSTFTYFVTSTRAYSGTAVLTQPTTVTTIPANAGQPGTVIVEAQAPGPSTSSVPLVFSSTSSSPFSVVSPTSSSSSSSSAVSSSTVLSSSTQGTTTSQLLSIAPSSTVQPTTIAQTSQTSGASSSSGQSAFSSASSPQPTVLSAISSTSGVASISSIAPSSSTLGTNSSQVSSNAPGSTVQTTTTTQTAVSPASTSLSASFSTSSFQSTALSSITSSSSTAVASPSTAPSSSSVGGTTSQVLSISPSSTLQPTTTTVPTSQASLSTSSIASASSSAPTTTGTSSIASSSSILALLSSTSSSLTTSATSVLSGTSSISSSLPVTPTASILSASSSPSILLSSSAVSSSSQATASTMTTSLTQSIPNGTSVSSASLSSQATSSVLSGSSTQSSPVGTSVSSSSGSSSSSSALRTTITSSSSSSSSTLTALSSSPSSSSIVVSAASSPSSTLSSSTASPSASSSLSSSSSTSRSTTLSSATLASTASQSTAVQTPAQGAYPPPSPCPASPNASNRDQNVTVGASSWAVRCGSDIYAGDVQPNGNREAPNGYTDCFGFCDANPSCGGFSFAGPSSGVGSGTCYLKQAYSNGPIIFFNTAPLAAYRIPPPSGNAPSSGVVVPSSSVTASTTRSLTTGSPSTSSAAVSSSPISTSASTPSTSAGCASGFYGTAVGSCPADNNTIITDPSNVQYYIGCGQDLRGFTLTPNREATNITQCFQQCSTGTFSGGQCYGFALFQGFCYFQTFDGPQQLVAGNNVVAVIRPSYLAGYVAPAVTCTRGQTAPASTGSTSSIRATTTSLPATTTLGSSALSSSTLSSSSRSSSLSSTAASSSTSTASSTGPSSIVSTASSTGPSSTVSTASSSVASPTGTACPGVNGQTRTTASGVQYRVMCGMGTTGNDLGNSPTTNSYDECFAGCDSRPECQGISWLGSNQNVNGIGQGTCYFKTKGVDGGDIQFSGNAFGNPQLVSAIRLNQALWSSSSSSLVPRSVSSSTSASISLPSSTFQTTTTTTTTTPSPLGTVTSTTYGAYSGTTTLTTIPYSGTQSGTVVIGIPVTRTTTTTTTTTSSSSSSSSSRVSSTVSAPATYGSPAACPGPDQNVTASTGTSWTVRCGSDIYAADVVPGGNVEARNGYADCFAACDAEANCDGFAFAGAGNTGTGVGTCYLKSAYSGSQVVFFGQATVGAFRIAGRSTSSTSTTARPSTFTGTPATSAASSASPTGTTCPGIDQRNLTDSSGVTYSIRCSYDTFGADVGSAQSMTGFTGCFAGCNAIASCAGFTWQSQAGATDGSGTGQCYYKSNYDGSAISFFNPGNANNVAAIRVAPPRAAPSSSSTSARTSSVAVTGSATVSAPFTAGSPTTCPGTDNRNVTTSSGLSYLVRCTYDTDGFDLANNQALDSWTQCFDYCDANPSCAGFTWQSQTTSPSGTGFGICYYKSYSGTGSMPFKGPQNSNNIAAVKSNPGAVGSGLSTIRPAFTTTQAPAATTSTFTRGPAATQTGIARAQDASCPTNDRWTITDPCGVQYILGCYTDTRVGSPNAITGLTSWNACLQACSSGQYASTGPCISFTYSNNLCYLKYYDSVSSSFDVFQGSNANSVAAIQLAYYNSPGPYTTATTRTCTFTGSPTVISQTANAIAPSASAAPRPSTSTPAPVASNVPGGCPGINNTVVSGTYGIQYNAYCGSDASGTPLGSLGETTSTWRDCSAYCDSTPACAGFSWSGQGGSTNGGGTGFCYYKQITRGNPVGPTGSGNPTLLALIKVNPNAAVTLSSTTAAPATTAGNQGSATGTPGAGGGAAGSGGAGGGGCPAGDNQIVYSTGNIPYRIRCRYDTTGITIAQGRTTTNYTQCYSTCDGNSACLAFTWVGIATATYGNGNGTCYFRSLDSNNSYPVFTGEGRNTALVALIKAPPGQASSSSSSSITQSYTTSYTNYLPSGTTTQAYTASSVAPSGTAQGTIIVATPIPTTPCLADAFLSQVNVVYRLELSTGNLTQLFTMDLGSNPNQGIIPTALNGVNSLGYNPVDNYLYGTIRGPNPETLIRIGYDGSYQPILTLPGNSSTYLRHYIGDVDATGQYWTASQQGGQWRWIQVNLNPSTPNYGQIVASGSTPVPLGGIVQDWAFVPSSSQQSLYALHTYDNGSTILNAFSIASKTWSTVGSYAGITLTRMQITDANGQSQSPSWNALYATSDGFLYATEGFTGQLWRFNTQQPLGGNLALYGPRATEADGARCITNTTPI